MRAESVLQLSVRAGGGARGPLGIDSNMFHIPSCLLTYGQLLLRDWQASRVGVMDIDQRFPVLLPYLVPSEAANFSSIVALES